MALTIPNQQPVTDAIIDTLEGAGLTVVDNHAEDWDNIPKPYVVVQGLPGRHGDPDDGSIGDPFSSGFYAYSIRSVAIDRIEAEHVNGRVRSALFDQSLTIPGTAVDLVQPDTLGVTNEDDSVRPALHSCTDVIRIWTTG